MESLVCCLHTNDALHGSSVLLGGCRKLFNCGRSRQHVIPESEHAPVPLVEQAQSSHQCGVRPRRKGEASVRRPDTPFALVKGPHSAFLILSLVSLRTPAEHPHEGPQLDIT